MIRKWRCNFWSRIEKSQCKGLSTFPVNEIYVSVMISVRLNRKRSIWIGGLAFTAIFKKHCWSAVSDFHLQWCRFPARKIQENPLPHISMALLVVLDCKYTTHDTCTTQAGLRESMDRQDANEVVSPLAQQNKPTRILTPSSSSSY